MLIIETVAEFQRCREDWRIHNGSVGFVPTMGALHDGHVSLVERARRECRFTVVSIFVNPTQFNNPQDLASYPHPLAQDIERLSGTRVDAVFVPRANEIYHDDYRFEVEETKFSKILCGAFRPGHFKGVLTVVLKLLNIVKPQRAYFGEKDFQQLTLIRDMVSALFLDIEIVSCPTVRDADGLALSSRNALLSAKQRALAPVLYRILKTAPSALAAFDQLTDVGFKVDYVEDLNNRRLAAASLGSVRLIDNVEIG